MASALPSEERTAKSFSLFSVVSFPNDECTTTAAATAKGICITAEECDKRSGGKKLGNCASGFGVCCVTITGTATTGTITNTATYIQSPNFPTGQGASGTVTASTHTYMISGGSGIAQIRLDFITAVLGQPSTSTGLCPATEGITLTQGANTLTGELPKLCGTLTGQHIYLDHSATATPSSIAIATAASALTGGRSWNIQVRLLEADSSILAPKGCRQFFTGETGTITSLNHLSGTATGTILGNTNYKACIRLLDGNNCVDYTQATTSSFALAGGTTSAQGGTCTADAVIIGATRFCGGKLSTVASQSTGSVVSSAAKMPGIRVVTTASGRTAASAFQIRYSQKATC